MIFAHGVGNWEIDGSDESQALYPLTGAESYAKVVPLQDRLTSIHTHLSFVVGIGIVIKYG